MINRLFTHCKGAYGRMIKLRGWAKTTMTYQIKGYCRKCARARKLADFRKQERKARGTAPVVKEHEHHARGAPKL